MTIVPSFLVTGLLAMGLGLLTLVWAAAFVQRPHGGLVLALLSLGLLLLGGGIVPPIIGIIGGVVGTRIHAPLPTPASPLWQGIARLWPWTIVLFFALIFGQVVIGYFANGSLPLLVPAGILGLLVATLLAGYGHDIQAQGRIDA